MGGLVSAATGLLQTRLALLGTELRGELARWTIVVLGACAAIALGALALGAASAAILIAAGPEHRVAAGAALASAFAGGAAYAAWRVRAVLAQRGAVFAASLAELENDRAALEGVSELGRLVSIGMLAYGVARRLRRAAE